MNASAPPPCSRPTHRLPLRRSAGVSRLEFALAVIVAGVIVTLALQRIDQLQGSARSTGTETRAAQARSLQAIAQACPAYPSSAPLAGAATTASSPSCQ